MALEILQYGFMQKALIAGILISIVCSLIGLFLVLRKLSLLSDGLAHTAFGGLAIGLLLGINPIIAALFFTVISAVFLQKLIKKTEIYGDAATALVLSFGLGIAVIIIGIAKGFTVDLFSYLFGSILAVSALDLYIIGGVFLITISFIASCYKQLSFISFNEDLATVSGLPVNRINTLFSILVGMVVVISMRAVGILLVSAMIVIPTISALQLSRSFKSTLAYSLGISIFSVIAGIFLSYYLNLPTGGAIVMLMFVIFITCSIIKSVNK